MTEMLIELMEKEDLNLKLFPSLDSELLNYSIINDVKTDLKDILFDLFRSEINNENKVHFNKIFENCRIRLEDEIDKLGHVDKEGLIVWHLSVFMSLKLFRDSVESKYSLKDEIKIIELFNSIFNSNFYKFISYNSKKERLQYNLLDSLCNEIRVKGYKYVYKKSKSKVTINRFRETKNRRISYTDKQLLELNYKPEVSNKLLFELKNL